MSRSFQPEFQEWAHTVELPRVSRISIGAAVLALLTRLYIAVVSGVWVDERNTIRLVTSASGVGLAERVLTSQPHFPTYYLFVDGLIYGPESVFDLRLIAVGAGAITTLLVAELTRREFGLAASLTSAGILAVSPFWVWWGANARMYSLVALATAVTLWGSIRRPAGLVSRYAESGGAVTTAALHPFGLFAIGLVIARRLLDRGLSARQWIAIAAGAGVIGLGTTHVLRPVMIEAHHLTPPSLVYVLGVFPTWVLGYKIDLFRHGLTMLGFCVIGYGLPIEDLWSRGYGLLVAWVAVPVVVTVAVSYLVWPVFDARYLIPAAVAFVVFLGAAVETLSPRLQVVTSELLVLSAAVGVPRAGRWFWT